MFNRSSLSSSSSVSLPASASATVKTTPAKKYLVEKCTPQGTVCTVTEYFVPAYSIYFDEYLFFQLTDQSRTISGTVENVQLEKSLVEKVVKLVKLKDELEQATSLLKSDLKYQQAFGIKPSQTPTVKHHAE